MIKFHIFLESGARIEMAPMQESQISRILFNPEEKQKPVEATEKRAYTKRRKFGIAPRWTPEEDALIEPYIYRKVRASDIRDLHHVIPNHSRGAIATRIYDKKKAAQSSGVFHTSGVQVIST